MKNKIYSHLPVIMFGVLVISFLAVFYIFAWTEPTADPPGGNVPAPLNTGSEGQVKIGGLMLNTGGFPNGLIVDQGNVGIGTTSPSIGTDGTGGQLKLDVEGFVGATKYCDKDGNNCKEATYMWGSFGVWETKNRNQVYTASTDGFVLAFCYAANSANGVTPDGTLPRTGCEASGTQADGFTMPVRKGDTWAVYLTSGAGNVTVYWLPLGQ